MNFYSCPDCLKKIKDTPKITKNYIYENETRIYSHNKCNKCQTFISYTNDNITFIIFEYLPKIKISVHYDLNLFIIINNHIFNIIHKQQVIPDIINYENKIKTILIYS